MPRIPTTGVSRVNYERSTVPLGGIPNVDTGESRALSGIGDALSGSGKELVNFREAMTRADDEDAMGEIELQVKTRKTELQARMRENPNAYKDFEAWNAESDKTLQAGIAPHLEKLSPRARARAGMYLAGQAQDQAAYTRQIAFQADITAKRGNYDNRIRQYAKLGDVGSAEAELKRAVDSGVFHSNETDVYRNHISELSDFGAVEREVDGGSLDIAERLKKRAGGGAYVHFPALSEASRKNLIRYAEQAQAKRETEQDDQFLASLLAGDSITEDYLSSRQAAGEITLAQQNRYTKIVRDIQQAKDHQLTEAEKKARIYSRDALEFEIMEYKFSPDPAARAVEVNNFNRRIIDGFAKDDPAYAKQLKSQLNSSIEAIEKPDASYKKSFAYVQGDRMLDGMKKDFYSRYPGRGDSWYSAFTNVYNDDSDLKADNFAMAKIQFDSFMKANPKATPADVETFLGKLKKDVNRAECDKLVDFWSSYRVPNVAAKIDTAEVERQVNGRTAVFSAKDKTFLRWKDGK